MQSESPPRLPAERPNAIAVFVLGLLSLVAFGLLLGVPAWILSARQLKRIRTEGVSSRHRGLLRAALVLGIVGTFLTTFFAVDIFLYFLPDIFF